MKKLFFGFLALACAVTITSCSSTKGVSASAPAPAPAPAPQSDMVEINVPLSGPQYRTNGDYYRATQSGRSTNISMAQKVAYQNCRQQLAAAIQADVKAVIENYAKNTETALTLEAAAQYQELAYTVIDQKMKDVGTVDEKTFRKSDGSYEYYVCLEMAKKPLEDAIVKSLENEAELKLQFDREQFKKVYQEQMAAFSQQNQ